MTRERFVDNDEYVAIFSLLRDIRKVSPDIDIRLQLLTLEP